MTINLRDYDHRIIKRIDLPVEMTPKAFPYIFRWRDRFFVFNPASIMEQWGEWEWNEARVCELPDE